MKLAEANGVVERDGIAAESGFTIAATAKAFEILSSKLYSDIPRAVIRELSTNASDAQIEAGNGHKPFDVHLPNFIEPFFQIRDYGLGLSPEDVKEIYTVYFASTRSHSDEFTGALGLGSKSPFAYTDGFTVTSYYKGIAYTYSLFKNEKNLPSITLLAKSPTSEANGVEIRIAIKQQDHNSFLKAASSVYHYFNVKPNIVGGQITTFNKPKVDIEGNGYKVTSNNGMASLSVVMGQVCYQVTSIRVDSYGLQSYDTSVELYAKVGECSFAASREELHMDDRTIKFIEDKMSLIASDMNKKMIDEMSLAKTTIEKIYIQTRYSSRLRNVNNQFVLSGESINNYKIVRMSYNTRRRSNRVMLYIDGHASDFTHATAESPPNIIENDSGLDELSKKIRSKIIHWMTSQNGRNGGVYLAKIQDRTKFLKDFNEPLIKLSQLPDPPKEANVVSSMERNKSCIRKLNFNSRSWDNVESFEEGDGIAIVHRDNNHIMFNGKKHNIDFLKSMMNYAGIKTVYGIPTRLYSKYDGDLEDIFTLAKNKIEERIKNLTDYEFAAIKHPGSTSINQDLLNKIKHINKVCEDFAKFTKARHDLSGEHEIAQMASLFEIKLVDKPNFSSIFMAKYPILTRLDYIPTHEVDSVAKEIEIYIKAKGV